MKFSIEILVLVSFALFIGCTPTEQFFAEKNYLMDDGSNKSPDLLEEKPISGANDSQPEVIPNAIVPASRETEPPMVSVAPAPAPIIPVPIIPAPIIKYKEIALILDKSSALSVEQLYFLKAENVEQQLPSSLAKINLEQSGAIGGNTLYMMCISEADLGDVSAMDSRIKIIDFTDDKVAGAISLLFNSPVSIPYDLAKFKIYFREVVANLDSYKDMATCGTYFNEADFVDVHGQMKESRWIELAHNVVMPEKSIIVEPVVCREGYEISGIDQNGNAICSEKLVLAPLPAVRPTESIEKFPIPAPIDTVVPTAVPAPVACGWGQERSSSGVCVDIICEPGKWMSYESSSYRPICMVIEAGWYDSGVNTKAKCPDGYISPVGALSKDACVLCEPAKQVADIVESVVESSAEYDEVGMLETEIDGSEIYAEESSAESEYFGEEAGLPAVIEKAIVSSEQENSKACLKVKVIKRKIKHGIHGKSHWHIKIVKLLKKNCDNCRINFRTKPGKDWKVIFAIFQRESDAKSSVNYGLACKARLEYYKNKNRNKNKK